MAPHPMGPRGPFGAHHGRGPRGGKGGPGGFPGGPGGFPGHRGGPFGRGRGGWQTKDLPSAGDASSWFTGRLPSDWFSAVDVIVDREEIVVIGTLVDDVTDAATAAGRIARFRADTKADRIAIAEEAQARYGRTVSWGARLGDTETLFTHLAVPVMTRLRQPERQVLDTLVDAGVARSRSDALGWAVRLVGEHADEWLGELRKAMAEVDRVRQEGPGL